MEKDEILNNLYNKGYKILIEVKDNSKFVTFTSHIALEPLICSHCYSMEWSNEEIKRDVVYDLLQWSGLKIKLTLD